MSEIVIGYHATSKSKSKKILENKKFDLKPFKKESLKINSKTISPLPGDLGSGAYFFTDNEKYLPAKKMASSYYNVHKRNTYNNENPYIITCELYVCERFNKMDMNNVKNIKTFNEVRDRESETIKKVFEENVIQSNAKNRMNVDGIIIEMLISKLNKKGHEVDYVEKDSYTEIDKYSSKVSNCRELCMRNQNMIASMS